MAVGKTVINFAVKIEKRFEEGAKLATNPNTTSADIDKWRQDLHSDVSEGTQNITEEAAKQARDAVTKIDLAEREGTKWLLDELDKSKRPLKKLHKEAEPKPKKEASTGAAFAWLLGIPIGLMVMGSFITNVFHIETEDEKTYHALQHELRRNEMEMQTLRSNRYQ